MDERDVRERLEQLLGEHRALDDVLGDGVLIDDNALGVSDLVGRMRAKKHKLRLRDEIAKLESLLIPDIIA